MKEFIIMVCATVTGLAIHDLIKLLASPIIDKTANKYGEEDNE